MAWAFSRFCRASGALATAAPGVLLALANKHTPPRCEARSALGTEQINHGPVKIFTGNAHRQLAQDIAENSTVVLSSASVGRFQCGEVSVVLNESVRDCDVFIIQPTCNGGAGPQEHLVELLIMIDAVRRSAANRITAVIPHFGYARQNAKLQSRTPITAKLVTDMLEVAGVNRVMTIELHVPQIQGFSNFPVDNLYALPLLASEVENIMVSRGLVADDIVVVSPDVGGAKRAAAMAKRLHAPLAIFSKQRRRATQKKELDLVGEVEGKTCIIIDDVADSCKTICDAAETLKMRGASTCIATIIHGVLSEPACDAINDSSIEALIVTDTIPQEDKVARCPKIRVISVAPLLGNAMQRVHKGETLSCMFEN